MADSKLSALTQQSVPALGDFTYVDDITGPTSVKQSWDRALGLLTLPGQGRLTTETGVPVSITDRTAQGTIYYTPYVGKIVTLYDGTRWRVYSTAEISLALTATSGKNYDVFLYDNAGTITMELSAAWTNDTTRADALTTQDGVQVKSGALTRRWVGTIRASGTNVTADSGGTARTSQVGAQRFVWNAYNQVRRPMSVIDTTDSWAYTTGTIRQANGATGNKNEWVTGDAATLVEFQIAGTVYMSTSASGSLIGIGIDTTTAMSGVIASAFNSSGSMAIDFAMNASYRGVPGLGYHYASWNEKGATVTCTFTGDNGGDGRQTGLVGSIFA